MAKHLPCTLPQAVIDQFLREAEAGGFMSAVTPENGVPYALGAWHTGNLFTLPVIEEHDVVSGGSVYYLDEDQCSRLSKETSA